MCIKVTGAKENNLKNITVKIPHNKLVVVTGVSGSGKSSLVFDTIFNEAQREYVDSLNTYARKSMPRFSPANVELIKGLSPCIVIDQKQLTQNPRSTVGTITEINTYLRLLYSRLGKPALSPSHFSFNTPAGACSTCKGIGREMVPDLYKLLDKNKSLAGGAINHKKWHVGTRYWNIINSTGIFDMNKPLVQYDDKELDTLLYSRPAVFENEAPGYKQSFTFQGVLTRLSGIIIDEDESAGKSYHIQFYNPGTCSQCQGDRLNKEARSVKIDGKSFIDILNMEITDLLDYISSIKGSVADLIVPLISKPLEDAVSLGIGYLTLSRPVTTLSAGESQKVRLVRQLGSSLIELIYILDEPTIGLHPRDVDRMIQVLRNLVDKKNTVIVVEHDKDVILKADHIIDMGPEAGQNGGEVLAEGTPEELIKSGSETGKFISGEQKKETRNNRKKPDKYLHVENASLHNLKNINVGIPLNTLTCITGVSGSGKSSLVQVLLTKYPEIIVVDQSSAGSSPRSNTATYIEVFGEIREEFAYATGKSEKMFTFNGEGACEDCNGLGYYAIDMHFLGDIRKTCETCHGKRFSADTLKYKYNEKSIADVLDMTVSEAQLFFKSNKIKNKLKLLIELGLGYLRLGQPLDTLSGGESQRVKLVKGLTGKVSNIYVLDEPTSGLHYVDIDRLLSVLNKLVDKNNTVIVVEHNLEIIKNADWIIDLGPEGGKNGGKIVTEGTPETIAENIESHTGRYLARPV